VCVAGSIGPLGISALEAEDRGIDRAQCFRDQVTGLLQAARMLFFETFMDFDEMSLALAAARSVGSAPVICSSPARPKASFVWPASSGGFRKAPCAVLRCGR
jgi:methionine synthase I (cobalamin-dependent)